MSLNNNTSLSDNAILALTEGQKEIWVAQQMIEDSARYNTAECVRIEGVLSPDCFKAAVTQVMRQIEALNCRYQLRDGELVQVIGEPAEVNYQFLDFRRDEQPEISLRQWMRHDLAQPVDLAQGRLYRVGLIQLADEKFCWYQRAHHIALDGYGVAMVLRQVANTYSRLQQGKSVDARPFSPLRYLLDKEDSYRNSTRFLRDTAFWEAYCRRLPPAPRLSPARAEVSDSVRRERLTLRASQFARIKTLAKAWSASWVEVWLALFAGYVAWKTRESGVVLGMPFMNRNDGELFKLPAMLVNILPLSVQVGPDDDLASLAQSVRREIDYVKPHTEYRGMRLLRLREDDEPLFGPVVNVMPFYEELDFNGARGVIENVHGGPVDDCALRVVPTGNDDHSALQIHLDANPNIYPADVLSAIRDELMAWATYWIAHPHASMAQLNQRKWRELADYVIHAREQKAFAWRSVISRIREQAALTPEAVALESDDRRVSYAALAARVDAIGGALIERGIQAGEVIAVYMPRSADTVQMMLGILAAGASCFVLDTASPDERLQQALDACGARFVIMADPENDRRAFTVESIAYSALLTHPEDRTSAPAAIAPDATGFIIFTSGSTGKPKGVAIPHRALSWFVDAAGQAYNIQPDDRVLQFSSLTFDACLEEIFIPLCCGACVVLRSEEMAESLDAFLSYVIEHAVTVLDLPTTFWHTLTLTLSEQRHAWPAAVKTLIVGGEAISQERLSQWKSLMGERVRLINTYGPTEGTIIFTYKVLAGDGFDPRTPDLRSIGLPLTGLRCLILDAARRPVERGMEGELYLIGPTLSSGYINSDEMTRESFITLTIAGKAVRAYKTGDWVTQTEQGEIVYLGRIDKQVKFRGYRVDLNEIRDCCLAVDGVKEARAVMWNEGNAQLVLYVKLDENAAVSCGRIEAHLRKVLPQYMQPNQVMPITDFPLTRSGKIDEKRLPKPDVRIDAAAAEDAATDFERQVAEAWKAELTLDSVGIHQDFYALGGSSLNLFSIHARLAGQGLPIPPKLLLENRTIHSLYQAWRRIADDDEPQISGLEWIVKLQNHQRPRTLWAFHPYSGRIDCYRELAERVNQSFDVLAIQAPYLSESAEELQTLSDLAQRYCELIRHVQQQGPYYLIGYSLGGNIAYLVAQRLIAQGGEIHYLGLLDSRPPQFIEKMESSLYTLVRDTLGAEFLAEVRQLDDEAQLEIIAERLLSAGHMRFMDKAQLIRALRFSVTSAQDQAAELTPLTIAGQTCHYGVTAPGDEWRMLVRERLNCHQFDGKHDTIMDELAASGAMQAIQQDLFQASRLRERS
ncbi:amino acid adenylation domain-containing protein [Brenneria izadpanahii]|uniref:Amino acid adenylation domain-containing protein n=1 Tax=Brenneria izadpanahii TaxID=2722756 RepID=A0ABX7USN6_9GAMM|nr:non-ribosomal peptide synthetase [Brenneria izadpanahii]QTF08738.1 amino acid adenylation domain-containing protein [Brenneria izadpanahii]